MPADLGTLSAAAVTIGFVHTLSGPDHYVPFVAMSRVGQWSLRKTVLITLLCGIGHVGGSVLLGFLGIACGVVVLQLEQIEGVRGDLAAWLLIGFGAVYFAWGLWRAIRNVPHSHLHWHAGGTLHSHEGVIIDGKFHEHGPYDLVPEELPKEDSARNAASGLMTPWVLFVIFIFGPCEPLIPFLMYPAAQANAWGVVWVTLLFALATLSTMVALVVLMYRGLQAVHFRWIERYSHAMAGALVLACGLAIMLGL